jgi:small-conductance mechanosensitive channel
MQAFLEQATRALPLMPTVLVILLTGVALRLSRRILEKAPDAVTRGAFRIQIAHLAIWLVAVLLVLVVLPVDETLRGQLLSLFGIVLSAAIALSSTTFVGNVMAGVMLKAVRNFRTGDFLQVGDHFGRVTQRGLLSTEIQTEFRDLVTLPNLHLVTYPVTVIRTSGTIITTEVSLGYDVAHGDVETLLEQAAETAGLSEPFVLVTNLGDFSVTYRVAGLLEEVKQLLTVRSRLRKAVLDTLHSGGVEIVSPNFMNQRVLPLEQRFVPQGPKPPAPEEPQAAIESIVFDKADEAESLEQLVAAHKKTREEIATLADPPDDADPETVKRRQEQLTRRLAQLEAAIAQKKDLEAADDPDS